MAKRVLIAQVALLVAGLLVILIREFPGLIREIRIWRMVGVLPRNRGRSGRH
jgi:hypothetical protein